MQSSGCDANCIAAFQKCHMNKESLQRSGPMKIRSQKGAAVVEFAVVLPLLLLIVFGIVEFGFLLYNQAMLTNASREGARTAILNLDPRNSTANISTIVTNYTQQYLVTFSSGSDPGVQTIVKVNGVEADPSVVGLSYTDFVTVEVTYQYSFLILPSFVKTLGLTQTLFASATMRAE
jgi:Flp pilus assembly protein TadG